MRRRIVLLSALVLVAVFSCHDSVNLPPVQGPPLQVPEGSGGVTAPPALTQQPLKVVHVSPVGQLTSPHLQITVSFNKPMVALELAEDQRRKSPLVFEPRVAAKQRWLGTRTLVLEPGKPLAGSTRYTVTLPKGVKALDGTALAQQKRWSFTTPLLKVARTKPYRNNRWLQPDTAFELFFNQPVDPATLQRHLVLRTSPMVRRKPWRKGDPRARPKAPELLTVSTKIRRGRDARHLVIKPTSLPLNSHVMLELRPTLTGSQGPIPMGKPFRASFTTYGPLRITGVSCTKDCDPEGSLSVRFSNGVRRDWARKAIRVSGRRLKVGTSKYASTSVWIDTRLGARRRYTITVAGGLKDKYGQRLTGQKRWTFGTGDFDPYVRLPISSGVLEDRGAMRLPIAFRNATSAQLRSLPLSPAKVAGLLGHKGFWDSSATLLGSMPGVRQEQLKVNIRRNKRVTVRRDLKQLLGRARGMLALELETKLKRRRTTDREVERAVVRVTDLALNAKHSPEACLVWVTTLSGGAPVAGAAISIWEPGGKKALWQGKTNPAGLAVAPGVTALRGKSGEAKLIYFASHAGDQSYVVSTSQSGISPWDFGLDAAWHDASGSLRGLLITDRGLYRPGDTVHLKGILRRWKGSGPVIPAGKPVQVKVSDARGEKLVASKLSLSEFGTFSLDVKLPAGAPLGSYSVRASPGGQGTVHGSFRVEEYRPAEFKVGLTAQKAQLVRGGKLDWRATGAYLFGSPMRGAKLNWSLYWQPTSFAPPKHEGYHFADEVWYLGSGSRSRSGGFVAQGKRKLDRKGKLSGARPLKPARMIGPRRYALETTVTDISRQAISARTKVLLHPGAFYLGAQPAETFLKAGQTLKTKVLAVAPDGQRVAGVAVAGTLFRRQWHSVRKKGMGGSHYFVSRPVETSVGTCRLRSSAKPMACDLKLPKAGYYVLRLKAKDKQGNPLRTSFGVYVAGDDYVAWRRDAEDRVELVKDRKVYKVGQVARILIKSPYAKAHGLLTVERSGIHLQRTFQLKHTSKWVNIPITRELLPDAYVSVVLVRGRMPAPKGKKKANKYQEEDPGKPAFKVGYTRLQISRKDRVLKVAVTPQQTDYRPGQEAVVDLVVTDHKGQPAKAELTVIAADEGVLSLIGHKLPDPVGVFYAPMGLSVYTADNRLKLLSRRVFGEKGNNPGGGGGESGESGPGGVRSKFVTTPYYNPAVLTDDQGRARVKFKLPDNLTAFRVMALAVTADSRFGKGRGQVKVNKPLLMLPSLPRFVRVGDTIKAGVVVHNNRPAGGKLRVTARAAGVELIGASTQQLDLAGESSVEARFSFRASEPGQATFVFAASMGDAGDTLELKRPVKLPLVMETVATYGSTDKAAAEGVVPSAGIRGDVGGLEVAMSSSALVGLKAGMEYLLDYPYECLEQSTSRMVPLVLLDELSKAYKLQQSADAPALVARLIAKIEQLQRWDGGFSYWSASTTSSPWASAYATWGLVQAKKGGHKVSQRVLKQAARYLNKRLRDKEPKQGAAVLRNVKAYAAYVLVALGEKPTGYLSRLYEHRADLAVFGKSLLLSALVRSGGSKEMIKTLLAEVAGQVHQTAKGAKVEENLGHGYAPLFHSSTRSTAMLADALLVADPDNPLVEKMVRYLLHKRKNGRWRNTQETVYALLALHRYFKVREKQVPEFIAKIYLGNEKLLAQKFSGRSLTVQRKQVPMAKIKAAAEGGGTLGFVKQGTGRLYYSASLRYARTALPQKPLDAGFYVTRSYQPVGPEVSSLADLRGKQAGKGVLKVKAGQLVRVTLTIIAPQQMHFVAVDDPLPAGLESTNFKLMTASQHSRRHVSHGRRSRYGGRSSSWYTPFYQQQLRDDRVQLFADSVSPGIYTYVYLARATTAGTFVTPPTHVEQMYEPEVFGRTGAVTFVVQ